MVVERSVGPQMPSIRPGGGLEVLSLLDPLVMLQDLAKQRDAQRKSIQTTDELDISYKLLSLFDDVATYLLHDSLYADFTIHKMTLPSSPSSLAAAISSTIMDVSDMVRDMVVNPSHYLVDVTAIREILRKFAAKKIELDTAIDRIMNAAPWLHSWLTKHVSTLDYEHFRMHLSRYLRIYLPSAGFDVVQTLRYVWATAKTETAVLADRSWAPGDEIRCCSGRIVALTNEQEQELLRDGRDFSVVHSSRKGAMCLFLGPARLVNHDCDPNVQFVPTKNDIYFRVIKPIKIGDEITTDYGCDYFEIGNRRCLCETCEKYGRGAFERSLFISNDLPHSSLASTTSEGVGKDAYIRLHRRAKQSANTINDHDSAFSDDSLAFNSRQQQRTTYSSTIMLSTVFASSYTLPYADHHILTRNVDGTPTSSLFVPRKSTCSICLLKMYTFSVSDIGHVQCHKCIRHKELYSMQWPIRINPKYLKCVDENKDISSGKRWSKFSKHYSKIVDEDVSDIDGNICTVPLDRLRGDRRIPVFVQPVNGGEVQWWHVGVIIPKYEYFDPELEELEESVQICLFSDATKIHIYSLSNLKVFHPRVEPFVTYARVQPDFLKSLEVIGCLQFMSSGILPSSMWWWSEPPNNLKGDYNNPSRLTYCFPGVNVSTLKSLVSNIVSELLVVETVPNLPPLPVDMNNNDVHETNHQLINHDSNDHSSNTDVSMETVTEIEVESLPLSSYMTIEQQKEYESLLLLLETVFADRHRINFSSTWTLRGDYCILMPEKHRERETTQALNQLQQRKPLRTILTSDTEFHTLVDSSAEIAWEMGDVDQIIEKVVQLDSQMPLPGNKYSDVQSIFEVEEVLAGVKGELITNANERQLVYALSSTNCPDTYANPAVLVPVSDWESERLEVPTGCYAVKYIGHRSFGFYPRSHLRVLTTDKEPHLSWSMRPDIQKMAKFQLCDQMLRGRASLKFMWKRWRTLVNVLTDLGVQSVPICKGVYLTREPQQLVETKHSRGEMFDVGDFVFCVDSAGTKHKAKILDKKNDEADDNNATSGEKYLVHFNNWRSKFDEWVEARRLLEFKADEEHQDGFRLSSRGSGKMMRLK